MSEHINNPAKRKELLKHLILQIHEGKAPGEVRDQLIRLMKKVPYGEVVEVEQELISEGTLSDREVQKFCDLHAEALEGHIDTSGARDIPEGHPVDVFIHENRELQNVVGQCEKLYKQVEKLKKEENIPGMILQLRGLFNHLMDVDKHYQRKEILLFPFLEKHGITGPPKVMWGKHDEIRDLLKKAIERLKGEEKPAAEALNKTVKEALKPATDAVLDMIVKEEEILFPMSMDQLTDSEWYEVAEGTLEIGYCLYDPPTEWTPEGVKEGSRLPAEKGEVQLPSGSFTVRELTALLNALPVDLTFVDKNDRVKYFSQGKERIFARSRAILHRDVRMCHPPSSVDVVDTIINDFKSGKEDSAPFWIQMKGKFIHIEYFALRDENGEYLGTLEVSQNLTEKRKLEGEQRILSYSKSESDE